MRQICIIGDSWAGNIAYNMGVFDKPFSQHNFAVTNVSQGGASNQGQLQLLDYQILQEGKLFDYILWIYTEPVRNFTEFVSLDYSNDAEKKTQIYSSLTYRDLYHDLSLLEIQDFRYAQKLYDRYHIPFVLVGGAGKITADMQAYNFYSWILPSWNQEICGLKQMPVNCYLHHLIKMLDRGTYDKKQAITELELTNDLEKYMKSNLKKYPDRCHPSTEFYPALVDRIVQQIQ